LTHKEKECKVAYMRSYRKRLYRNKEKLLRALRIEKPRRVSTSSGASTLASSSSSTPTNTYYSLERDQARREKENDYRRRKRRREAAKRKQNEEEEEGKEAGEEPAIDEVASSAVGRVQNASPAVSSHLSSQGEEIAASTLASMSLDKTFEDLLSEAKEDAHRHSVFVRDLLFRVQPEKREDFLNNYNTILKNELEETEKYFETIQSSSSSSSSSRR
jgi:hypothetical protein